MKLPFDNMSKLSNSAKEAVDIFWAADTGCNPEDFDTDAVVVIERPAPNGAEYAQFFRRKQRLQITCSSSIVEILRNATYGQAQDTIFDVLVVKQALRGRIDRVRGPAYLGYLDAVDSGIEDPNVRLLSRDDLSALNDLRSSVKAQDLEHSGLEPEQPIAGYFVDRTLVSAAGYRVWGGQIAHIGLVTREEARGAGYGRACVRGIMTYAIKQGLIAQYRTLYENASAMAIARSLGFEDYAATIYVRAMAP